MFFLSFKYLFMNKNIKKKQSWTYLMRESSKKCLCTSVSWYFLAIKALVLRWYTIIATIRSYHCNNYLNEFIDHVVFVFQLRLLYECIPMAYIVSQAGGSASNGKIQILDIQPSNIHERSPIFLGSTDDVNEILDIIKKHEKKGW